MDGSYATRWTDHHGDPLYGRLLDPRCATVAPPTGHRAMADGDGARPPAAAPIRLPTAAEVEQAVLGVGRKRTNLFQAGAAARPPPVFPFTSSHPPPAPPPAPTTALLPPAAPVAAPAPAPAAAAAPAAPPAPPAGGVRPPSRPASPADGPAVTSGSVAAAAGPAVGDRRVPYIPKNPHSILVSARQVRLSGRGGRRLADAAEGSVRAVFARWETTERKPGVAAHSERAVGVRARAAGLCAGCVDVRPVPEVADAN